MEQESPEWVVVVGDVNSTLACALVTSKLRHGLGCYLAHVEAGLRSHDWRMPEEVNRVVTDRLSDLLFIPSRDVATNLLAEGISEERIRFAGNVMIDTLLSRLDQARQRDVHERLEIQRRSYAVATVHRPSNVDEREQLETVLRALNAVAREMPIVLPLHPRTRGCVRDSGVDELLDPLITIEPVGYLDMIALLDGASGVLTDSGGIQEETTALQIPCVTLRENTERPVTVEKGTNRLAPWPLTVEGVRDSFLDAASGAGEQGMSRPEGWDGRAAMRIVAAFECFESHESET